MRDTRRNGARRVSRVETRAFHPPVNATAPRWWMVNRGSISRSNSGQVYSRRWLVAA
jgi:hypothetical protein